MILERLRIVTWIFVLLFAVVDARLAHLQFVAREFWVSEGSATAFDGETIPFRRGSILDRFGRPLAFGEVDQTLNLVYYDFRRQTAIGRLHAALDLLATDMGRDAVATESGRDSLATGIGRDPWTPPRLHEVIQQPAQYASILLAESDGSIADLPRRTRDDFGFYVRSLLGLSPEQYRAARDRIGEDAPYERLVESGADRIARDVARQAQALGDLATAVSKTRAEILAEIEDEIQDIERSVAEAIESSPAKPDARQIVAFRRDYETRPKVLARGVPYRAVFLVNMAPAEFVGIEIHDVDARRYAPKYETISPKLIGWVGDTTPEICADTRRDELRLRQLSSMDPKQIDDQTAIEIERLKRRIVYEDYMPDEQFGTEGLEAVLEPALRGLRGFKKLKRDRAGRDVELLDHEHPFAGQDVRLTLDAELQLAAERALDTFHSPSAMVLLDPSDGAIRALACWPNPRREDVRANYTKLAKDRHHPLFQRCYQMPGNPPPPGSVFKLIVAAAGLESGALAEYSAARCEHYYPYAGKTLKCMHLHGDVDLKLALVKSCNIFFYKSALDVGFDRVTEMARRMGLGTPSGFGDPAVLGLQGVARSIGEQAFLPQRQDPKGCWGPLCIMQTAIGHGVVEDITPLQLATIVAPFANGGKRVRPYIVDQIGEAAVSRAPPEDLKLKASTLDVIRRSMVMVCDPGGTAGPFEGIDLRPYKVAGKTGTPQSTEKIDGKVEDVEHAWFVGFFPHDRPKVVFAIYAETKPGGGGRTCRPILWDLLQQSEVEPYL